MQLNTKSNSTMEADTISKNGASLKSLMSRGNNLLGLVFVVLAGLFMQSCASSKIIKTKNFSLTPQTSTAVIIGTVINGSRAVDREHEALINGICVRLESELLGLGFNIVPYEVAKKNATTTEFDSNTNPNNINSTTMTYTKTYIPASIAVSVVSYNSAWSFRVIDLSNNQLLATFSYGTFVQPKKMIKLFSKEISKYLQNG